MSINPAEAHRTDRRETRFVREPRLGFAQHAQRGVLARKLSVWLFATSDRRQHTRVQRQSGCYQASRACRGLSVTDICLHGADDGRLRLAVLAAQGTDGSQFCEVADLSTGSVPFKIPNLGDSDAGAAVGSFQSKCLSIDLRPRHAARAI